MPGKVLVAGASGALGRHVVAELVARQVPVRILTRRSGGKALPGVEVVEGDALKPGALRGLADGVDVVFSCLGASVDPGAPGRAGYPQVDTPANLALLEEARRAGVRRFVYVSVFHTEALAQLAYVKAHEDVVRALEASGLDFAVVRPTGFFSAFALMLPMAARGPLPVMGSGAARSNPIADEDLAQVCVEAVLGSGREYPAGGPQTLTRREVNAQVFAALGKADRSYPVPLWGLKLVAFLAALFHPRASQFLRFMVGLAQVDLVAPVRGQRTLGEALKARASRAG